MKKVFNILTIVCLGVFCAVLALSLTRRQVVANEGEKEIHTQVSELLDSYIDENGCYTKLTTLAYDETQSLYHAGQSQRQRRTYYNETIGALLMGNYDGTFGPINSGYGNNESNLEHFKNNAEVITLENLFNERKVDYSLEEETLARKFDILSTVSERVSESSEAKWSKSESNVYSYKAEKGATIDGNSYTNGLLKTVQYFAAPMLLLNNGIQLQSFEIYESKFYPTGSSAPENLLVIKLYTSTKALVSTAYIVKGLTMQANIAPMQLVIAGQVYDMVENKAASRDYLLAEMMLPEEIEITTNYEAFGFRINGADVSVGLDGNGGNAEIVNDGTRTQITAGGKINFFLQLWESGAQSLSVSFETLFFIPKWNWAKGDEKYAIKYFNDTEEQWVDAKDIGNGIFRCNKPEGNWTKLIIYRLDKNADGYAGVWNFTTEIDANAKGLIIEIGTNDVGPGYSYVNWK